MTLQQAQDILCGGAILVLILIMFACLIRAIRGPEIADRIVSVNMLGTLTIMVICILSFWLKENYLLDVALIYALISFLAVVVLVRVYLGVHRDHLRGRASGGRGKRGADKASGGPAAADAEEEARV